MACNLRSLSSRRVYLALVCLLWSGVLVLRATDRYVVKPGTIENGKDVIPYNTWTNAATNIQWAVDVATNTETVWVSNGVYVLTNQIVITNALTLRSIAGHGPDDTIINGGFAIGNTLTNRCIVLSNAAAFVSGLTFSNGASYITNPSLTSMAQGDGGGGVRIYAGILSNCTVRNNTVFSGNNYYVGGGGVYIYPSGTAVACRITDNLGTNIGAWRMNGGGIMAGETGSEISGCLISNNIIYGSGLAMGGGVSLNDGARIGASMLCSNRILSADIGYGGGVCIGGGGAAGSIMNTCTVTVNQASCAAGCYLTRGTITNCMISYNNIVGIQLHLGDASYVGGVYNTTIKNNTGGMQLDARGTGLVLNCAFISNTYYGVNMSGGVLNNCVVGYNAEGVWCGGGTIRNCLIYRNSSASQRVGLYIKDTCKTALVSCCTIVSNRTSTADLGSGIRFEATSPNVLSISSCIIYSNGASGADDVYDKCAPTNYGALQYSCVGSNPGFTGAVIIVANPQFKDFAGGNYRLGSDSPCINAGSNEDWMANSVDLDGRTRIRYGTVDMGAYERIHEGTIYVVH